MAVTEDAWFLLRGCRAQEEPSLFAVIKLFSPEIPRISSMGDAYSLRHGWELSSLHGMLCLSIVVRHGDRHIFVRLCVMRNLRCEKTHREERCIMTLV
jgi:hypothetical protein